MMTAKKKKKKKKKKKWYSWRRIQWYSGTKMTKKCVKIAYRSEIDKKEVKIGRVGLLPSISHTRVKAYVGRKLAYAGPFPRMQSLKNKAAYI